ncbi:MAG: hypothetical protein QXT45_05855 [Candidatus Bilamarchaeaceae archaeon]
MPIGLVEKGFEVRLRAEKELITDTQIYGDTVIDAVYRGGNCFMSMVCMEWGWAIRTGMHWPYGPVITAGTPNPIRPLAAIGFLGTHGRMDVGSGLFGAVTLTALNGTTAAATPAIFQAIRAVRMEGDEARWMFGATLRRVPVTLRLYPYYVNNPNGYPPGNYEAFFHMG